MKEQCPVCHDESMDGPHCSNGCDERADLECDHDGERKYVTSDGYCLLCGEMV